jgi:hypothetical protein
VAKEDARAVFTGTLFTTTPGANNGTATVALTATIHDISVLGGGDTTPGNIGFATVTFINRETGAAISPALPVMPVNAANPVTGTVLYNWTVSLGNNVNSENYSVGMRVTNYYTRDAVEEDVVVTVSRPLGNFITGGGMIELTNPAGQAAGDPGSLTRFGFNIKFNNAGTNLQGKVKVLYSRTEAGVVRTYLIKGTQMISLSINPENHAVFYGKANLQDITVPSNPVTIASNCTFQIITTDNGGGPGDLLGLALMSNNGLLWYSSNWNGTTTVEQSLAAGNVLVSGPNESNLVAPGGGKDITQADPDPVADRADAGDATRGFALFPNPAQDMVELDLAALSTEPSINVQLVSMTGAVPYAVQLPADRSPLYRIDLGTIATGVYWVRVSAGNGRVYHKKLVVTRD